MRLRLADGRELIDGMSSWWCAIHGYRHPVLDEAVREQLGRMAHVMFGGLTHEGGVRLAERLLELAPPGLGAVFFADSGSVSVEVAIKMSLQYQRAHGRGERTRLLTVRGGYHGDTFGAMAVCDPVGGMHSMFTGVLAEHVFAERPPDGFEAGLDRGWAEHVRELAEAKDCTPAQLALAWVLSRGDDVVPIPGTKRRTYLEQNAAAADVTFSDDELQRIDGAFPPGAAAGQRYADMSSIGR